MNERLIEAQETDGTTEIEITLPDGTSARWAVVLDDDVADEVIRRVTDIVGEPDTIKT